MKKSIAFIPIILIFSMCRSCPPKFDKSFEGYGFLVTNDPANSFVIFYPACEINKNNYLSSLNNDNVGKGITIPLYNLKYASKIINSGKRFKISKYKSDIYSYQGVYVVPAFVKLSNLQTDNPPIEYSTNYRIDSCTIDIPYIRASMNLDTINVLSYSP